MTPLPDWQRKFRDCVEMRDEALARIEELERERDSLHAAFPIYDSLARAEARVAELEQAHADCQKRNSTLWQELNGHHADAMRLEKERDEERRLRLISVKPSYENLIHRAEAAEAREQGERTRVEFLEAALAISEARVAELEEALHQASLGVMRRRALAHEEEKQ